MSIAWIFPGQGSQVVGMGCAAYTEIPEARAIFDQASAAIDLDLPQICFEGPEAVLTATENAQPAILTVSVALLRAMEVLSPGGVLPRPTAVAGHSLGEYSALVAAEALDLDTAVRLVRRRGQLMAAAREGTMAAVLGLDDQVLGQLCNDAAGETGHPVVIANYNAPGQFVISGDTAAVQRASALAKELGAKRVVPLKVSAAFHSPLMKAAAQGMEQALADTVIGGLSIPLIANVSASPMMSAEEVRSELVTQVVSPVCWVASIQRMLQQGVTTFVEIGPGTVLTGLIKRIAPDARLVNIRDIDDIRAFLLEE